MSIKLMSRLWNDAQEVTGNGLLVLLALADWANDEGTCWPSIASLARKTRLSERGVRYILDHLRDTGYISISEGGGRGITNTYQLHCPVQPITQLHPPQILQRVPPARRIPQPLHPFPGKTVQWAQPLHPSSAQSPQPLHPSEAETVQPGDGKSALASAPEPSMNHQIIDDSNRPRALQKPVPFRPALRSRYLSEIAHDFSREFGDAEHIVQNISQTLNLWRESGLTEQAFGELLHEARLRTRKAQSRPLADDMRNKMAYFFAVLRDVVARGEAPPEEDEPK